MRNKVVGLFRVSTLGQAGQDRASFETQRAAAERICEQYQLEMIDVIEYSDVSGASVLLAPEMQKLINLMMSGQIQGVIAREFSRLMRPESFADYALLQVFADTKTVLYLPEGPIDFSHKMGRFFGTLRAAMAGLERVEILERVWAAKEVKRKKGELAQGDVVLPYGVGYHREKGFYYTLEALLVREAALQFLAGNQNYNQLANTLGVTPRGVHLILRNPIWTGYRVIDKRRDPSASGKYAREDGRQADRRKIARPESEIIRVKVIDEPLLTDSEFQALQDAMDLKQCRHWRSDADYVHRFTYNNFLTCSECDDHIQTALARRDYYVCKGRRRSEDKCQAPYMQRERLEAILDQTFTKQLQSRTFLEACLNEVARRASRPEAVSDRQKLTDQLTELRSQRGRVVDLYVDGKIQQSEAGQRLDRIDASIGATEAALKRSAPEARVMDVDKLVEIFSPLGEWEAWSREQKRQVLATLAPDIRVANYSLESLGLNPALFSNNNTRTGMDSWRRPA